MPFEEVPISDLTPAFLKEVYLFGVDLKDVNGNVMSDRAIQVHINSALSSLETFLGIYLRPTVVKSVPVDSGLVKGRDYDKVIQRLPYWRMDASKYFLLKLPDSNIISIDRIRAYYLEAPVWEFTLSDAILEWKKPGVLHILPKSFTGYLGASGQYPTDFQVSYLSMGFLPGVLVGGLYLWIGAN